MARSTTTFAPGNTAALKHGLYARVSADVQATRAEVQERAREQLVGLKATIGEPELTIGARILTDLEQLGAFTDKVGGPVDSRGRQRVWRTEYNVLLGHWDRWCRRNGVGYVSAGGGDADPHGLAHLLADG